jgi:erythromycin esterase-like protein/predicted phosphoribosyltransferase
MRLERFDDRADAGRRLGGELVTRLGSPGRDDVLVLAIPRGGVPVGFEVARALRAPLDVFVVRKLGVPGDEELGFGAVATGGTRMIDTRIVEEHDIPLEHIEAIDAIERRELERRERAYRGDRPPPDIAGRIVVLVDDGLATGATMLVAVRAVREDDPARIVVAVPVAEPDVCEQLADEAGEAVCLLTPRPLRAVGLWYDDFGEVADDDVRRLLGQATPPPAPPPVDLRPLTGAASDYDPIVRRAGQGRFVLLGEGSHGTHDFYRARAEISKRLIEEHGYGAVCVEADWPDAARVNCFIQGEGDDATAEEALRDFRRFPVWMWRNADVAEFVTWLREWNDALPADAPKVSFHGLDLYSLHSSMEAVVAFLEDIDPAAAARARERYACFDHFGRDPQVYSYETGLGGAETCERQALDQLLELLHMSAADVANRDGMLDDDRRFHAEMNAWLVVDAERYYRAMFRGGVESWNLRDTHMADALDRVLAHAARTRGTANAIVWEHNSHLGDARATELGQAGEINVGQLVRERHGADALLVGFTTYSGTVTAASDWGRPAERRLVRRALPGSWEELFHETGLPAFLVDPRTTPGRRLERAIGVVYRPVTERISHYFHARLSAQFDAVIHIDETSAVEPLERTSEWIAGEAPETYPTGV